ncbi:MAG TPA: hypothetical protein P5555_01055 [Candidatus Paceibacterota bacterium]|nr:hypothetical protein [Verrucomicrobiota bacterium]HOX00973.1 hypothetical protein [Verrucomicrobiota bacterium]HRZ43761.1 hypothetical protein [Candidatus Paceibacterota bacterium]HRZ91356.1 hypothetical protein [Candidatus Paceibacterota bacterium]
MTLMFGSIPLSLQVNGTERITVGQALVVGPGLRIGMLLVVNSASGHCGRGRQARAIERLCPK